jgi:hypothetical protein
LTQAPAVLNRRRRHSLNAPGETVA